MWSSAPFPEISASSSRDCEKVSPLLSWLKGLIAFVDTSWIIRTFRQLEASEPVDTQIPMWSSAPFPEMSASSSRDRKKDSPLLSWLEGLVAYGDTLWLFIHTNLLSWLEGLISYGDTLWLSVHTILLWSLEGPIAYGDTLWLSVHTTLLLWLEGPIACRDTSWLSAPSSSRDNKSDDTRRQHMVAHTLPIQRLSKSLLPSKYEQVR